MTDQPVTPNREALWPTEAEQREIAQSLSIGFLDGDDNEFAQGVRTAINALLYREAPEGWGE